METTPTNTSSTPKPAMTQREIRKALLHNGHLPIPVQGKRPLLPNWQNLSPNEEMIDGWGETATVLDCYANAPPRLILMLTMSKRFSSSWD